jgi:hypothetical protein
MSRLDKYEKGTTIDIPFTSEEDGFSEADNRLSNLITQTQKSFKEQNPDIELESWMSQSGVLKASKELIFGKSDKGYVFHIIGWSINVRQGRLALQHGLDLLVDSDDKEECDQEIKNTLAIAYIEDIPVYPNTEELAPILAGYYRELMINGFTAPDGEGDRIKLKLTQSPGQKIGTIEYFNSKDYTQTTHPAELVLMRNAVREELLRLGGANKMLGLLEYAINELEGILNTQQRNENSIQKCITENPILLGLEYKEVIPKHKLGAEYEVDYALARYSGFIDFMELESSVLPLFNKKGDPSHHLIHSEQQVLNWLSWLEKNHAYASQKLSNIVQPLGIVIIGRSNDLSQENIESLEYRNSIYRGKLMVLTYDDVLVKAKTAFNILGGNHG